MDKIEIPTEQWALVNTSRGKLQVKKIPVPEPANGQILVKVLHAPINPSDLYCMKGMYDDFGVYKINYPMSAGNEASGIVVKSGGGMMANGKLGKNVAFTRVVTKDFEFPTGGVFQQYCLGDVMGCIDVDPAIPMEAASMSFVNPLTAIGLFQQIAKYKAKAVVQSGAASQLGRMVCYLCKQAKVPIINIVRREEQVDMLIKDYEQEHVLCTAKDTFFTDLRERAKELKATLFLDAVAGEMTGKTLECLPSRSTVVFYGALSEKPISEIDPLLLIGRSYQIQGFILGEWIGSLGLGVMKVLGQSNDLMKQGRFQSKIQKQFTLS